MRTLCFEVESEERLEHRLLDGSCCSEEVIFYLNLLAREAARAAKVVREEQARWEVKGLKCTTYPLIVRP